MKRKEPLMSFLAVLISVAVMALTFAPGLFIDAEAGSDKNGVNASSIRNFADSIRNAFDKNDDNVNDDTSFAPVSVYIGGKPIGLKLYCNGVLVVGNEVVQTSEGVVDPAADAGIKTGDLITEANGITVNTNAELSEIIESSNGEDIVLSIVRDGKRSEITFRCAYSSTENKYKAGLWIRDSSAGIGIVSFYDESGRFASLGHAVCDVDTKEVIPILSGQTSDVIITGLTKGENGKPGELCGTLEKDVNGSVTLNCDTGVFGEYLFYDENAEKADIASPSEAATGEAVIRTTVENGNTRDYSVEIISINENAQDNKNLIIKVTDETLISITGGIVQGMSGSPIIQNGKIIGVVTHVFMNDPLSGYGIFASTMYKKMTDWVPSLREKRF